MGERTREYPRVTQSLTRPQAVSRIIDALETTNTGIDLSRLAVTGCSRNGKGALVAGAFDRRIALVIPQESGSGGAGCWRISDDMLARGMDTQTASEIVQENVWFRCAHRLAPATKA